MNKLEEKNSDYGKNLELLRLYREGEDEAGEELVSMNMPLVYSIAARFSGRADQSDLVECGLVGLVKAIRTFDFCRECAFSTYAVPLIFGEMRRFLRDDGPIKVSREEKRLGASLVKERERRLQTGESVTLEALAEAVGVSPQDAASALFSASPVRSLDEKIFDGDDSTTLADCLSSEDEEERSFDKLALRMALDELCEMHKKIVMLRYFKDLSQVRVAQILGLSQVKVSREEKKIMKILKEKLDFS